MSCSVSVISGRREFIMKGCVQWSSVYGREDFASSEDPTRSARPVGQRLTHCATGAPRSFGSKEYTKEEKPLFN